VPKRLAPKKLGKISFNLQGGAVAAAQAKVQVEEAVAAARARRLNTKDASTQTVRDPEKDGDILTIWRLRPRGMESFPHFPKATKKKAREPTICAGVEEEEDAVAITKQSEVGKCGRKRPLDGDAVPEEVSESPERSLIAAAGDIAQSNEPALVAGEASDDDEAASLSTDALQAALARTAEVVADGAFV
jgi:hypothetical protein